MTSVTKISAGYRKKAAQHHDILVVYDDEIAGWMDDLCDPGSWALGSIAINEQGQQWRAVGGATHCGASEWQPINQAASLDTAGHKPDFEAASHEDK